MSGLGTMVFLPLTVWLLGITYGKVKNLVLKIFQPFLTKLKNRRRPTFERNLKHIFSPGFATRGQDLPLLHSLYGKSARIHKSHEDLKTRRGFILSLIIPSHPMFVAGAPPSDCNPSRHFLSKCSF